MKTNKLLLMSLRTVMAFVLSLILFWGMVKTVQGLAAPAPGAPVAPLPAAGWQAAQPGPRPVIVEAGPGGLVLELATPPGEIIQSSAGGAPCQLLKMPGYGETGQPGAPRLPVLGTLVGTPQNARLKLEILDVETQLERARFSICPGSQPVAGFDEQTGEALYNGELAEKDAAVYGLTSFLPGQAAVLGEPAMLRSQRAVQVLFQPYQYNPVSGELRRLQRIRVRLSFEYDRRFLKEAPTPAVDEGAYETLLRSNLINYEMARPWRDQPAAPARTAPGALPALGPQSFKLLVKTSGIYQVSYEALAAAGADFSGVDPATIQLFSQWQEAAIQVHDGGDNAFDPGDYFLFYGEAIDSIYTLENVYFVTWGAGSGKRMAALPGEPDSSPAPLLYKDSVHLEQDLIYRTYYPSGPEEDVWYWNSMTAVSGLLSRTYTTTLTSVASQPYTATVRGLIRSIKALPFHYTQLYLNENLVEEAIWESGSEHAIDVDVPQSYLLEGKNTLRLAASMGPTPEGITLTYNMLYINWFEIDYARSYVAENDRLFFSGQGGEWDFKVSGFTTDTVDVYDITDPLNVGEVLSASLTLPAPGAAAPQTSYDLQFQQALSGETNYLALSKANRLTPAAIIEEHPSALHNPASGADWIAITHARFITDLLPLAAHRQTQGYRTAVVDVQDIYDEFNGGVLDPQAIQVFLSYTYQNWPGAAPLYVLLMGDGHYDFRNILKRNETIFIPPYLAQVDPWQGETAADNRYVTISGADTFPDMYLGRITVRSAAETAGVVAKITGYELNPPATGWNTKMLFVADDYDPNAGDFAGLSDSVITLLHVPFTAQKIYYLYDDPDPGVIDYIDPVQTRNAIIAAINDGRGIVNYVGHGSSRYWAKEPLFGARDITSLTNAGRLPLILPMTCLEGQYHTPSTTATDYNALGERITRMATYGAIASWSPTGYGVASGHDYLHRGFFNAILNQGLTQLGPATQNGLLNLWNSTQGHRELIDTYILFGDPATTLQLPSRYYFFPITISQGFE
jgi:hypothetical protein